MLSSFPHHYYYTICLDDVLETNNQEIKSIFANKEAQVQLYLVHREQCGESTSPPVRIKMYTIKTSIYGKDFLWILYPISTWVPSTMITEREMLCFGSSFRVSAHWRQYTTFAWSSQHVVCSMCHCLYPLISWYSQLFSLIYIPFLTDDSAFSLAHPITVATHMVRRTRSLADVILLQHAYQT